MMRVIIILIWLAVALTMRGVPAAAAIVATADTPIATVTSPPSLDPASAASAWPTEPAIALPWDVVHSRNADEPTAVRVASDNRFLYVRFDVTQHAAVIATQHSNDTVTGGSNGNGGVAWSADDAVWVDLWPSGPNGFRYQFEANPNGAHNEASSENAAFSPQWESHGAIRANGYTVTMAIPLAVIHGAHNGTWRMQFLRFDRASGGVDLWSYEPAQSNPDDSSRAGSLTLTYTGRAPIPRPRAALYALGSVAPPDVGGSTSRIGADISVPVTPTAAFFATLHPDYSNVELDQQSISPTVYQRQYSEVRPFFTQAASFYNDFDCDACPGYRTTLYTPAIPTFSQGYAFEGKQGAFGFAAFDAIGAGRNDGAAALTYLSPNTHWSGSFQHVAANVPGAVDDTNEIGAQWTDKRYLSAYANVTTENGTLVTNPGTATVYDGGGGYGTPHFALFASARSVGAEFNPIDGYNSHAGIAGYGLYSARIWDFSPQSRLASVGISGFLDRYQGPIDGESQSDNQVLLDILTKSAWDLQLYSGSAYWRFGDALEPISQNGGFQLTYHSGLQTDNPNHFPSHGTSATPTQISYSTGRYGGGRLDTWFRTSTLRIGDKGTLSLTLDNTAQYFKTGTNNVQWFDGISYSYQLSAESSFAIGLRRVNGYAPDPNGGGNCAGVCSNVSVAYHVRFRNAEIYFAYGNPNTLVTLPQALLKVIFYVGGGKGT